MCDICVCRRVGLTDPYGGKVVHGMWYVDYDIGVCVPDQPLVDVLLIVDVMSRCECFLNLYGHLAFGLTSSLLSASIIPVSTVLYSTHLLLPPSMQCPVSRT